MAISNRNILALTEGQVTFRYRDSKTDASQIRTLPAERFIGRFLQHVLPRGFQKVRTYGLLHPTQRRLLTTVSAQLQPGSLVPADVPPASHSAPHLSHTLFRCPQCACEMIQIREIRRRRGPP